MTYIKVNSNNHVWSMHKLLKDNLDIIKKANKNDWDFKIIVSGNGRTRTGKSTLAFQIAQYIDPSFHDNWRERVIFDGKKLIETAYRIGKNKCMVYDEARKGLDSKRTMENFTKNLLDFFSECGNLNHEIIIVLPDYFELGGTIAITQTIFLVNCYTRNGFQRGYFDFYNIKDKKYLYIKGKKFKNYKSQKPSFRGCFVNYIPFDRDEYEAFKISEIKKIKLENNKKKIDKISLKHKERLVKLCYNLKEKDNFNYNKLASYMDITPQTMTNVYVSELKI